MNNLLFFGCCLFCFCFFIISSTLSLKHSLLFTNIAKLPPYTKLYNIITAQSLYTCTLYVTPLHSIFTITFFPFRRATPPFSLVGNSPGLEKNTSGSKNMLREKTKTGPLENNFQHHTKEPWTFQTCHCHNIVSPSFFSIPLLKLEIRD